MFIVGYVVQTPDSRWSARVCDGSAAPARVKARGGLIRCRRSEPLFVNRSGNGVSGRMLGRGEAGLVQATKMSKGKGENRGEKGAGCGENRVIGD